MSFPTMLCLLFLYMPACAQNDGWQARLDGIEVYGSSRLGPKLLRERFEQSVRRWLSMESIRTRSGRAAAARAKAELEESIRRSGNFSCAYAQKVSSCAAGELIVVFDVVEKKDAARRRPFRKLPAKKARPASDVDALLAAWNSYYDESWNLVRRGVSGADRVECPAFYCISGSSGAEAKALQKRFVAEVPSRKKMLERVLLEDPDPARRAAALCLFSYLRNGQEVSRALDEGLSDPDERVRDAALRVFSDIAIYHREVELPVGKVFAALDWPSVGDRGRALAALIGLADHPRYRGALLKDGADGVLRLLRMRNSSDRDMAGTVLRVLSSEDFGFDYGRWEDWLSKARTSPAKSSREK